MTTVSDTGFAKYGSGLYGPFNINIDIPSSGNIPYLLVFVWKGAGTRTAPVIGGVTLSLLTTFTGLNSIDIIDVYGTDVPPSGNGQNILCYGYGGNAYALSQCLSVELAGTLKINTGQSTYRNVLKDVAANGSDAYIDFILHNGNYAKTTNIVSLTANAGQVETGEQNYSIAPQQYSPDTSSSYKYATTNLTIDWKATAIYYVSGTLALVVMRTIPYTKPFLGRGYVIQ